MSDSFPLIFIQTQTELSHKCSSELVESLFESVPIQKIEKSAINLYKQKIREKMNYGEAAYAAGYTYPFIPKALKQIGSVTFEDPKFATLFVLCSFISWCIYFERDKTATSYAELVLSSILKAQILSQSDVCSIAFIQMYKILLTSDAYSFNREFFKILNTFINKNPTKCNAVITLLCATRKKVDKSMHPLLLKAIHSAVKNGQMINIDIADKVLLANADSIIEMNIDALHCLECLSTTATPDKHVQIFNSVPSTIVSLIMKESQPEVWPKSMPGNSVKLDLRTIPNILNQETTSATFKNGLGDLTPIHVDITPEFIRFCSQETTEKILLFIQTVSKQMLFSTIFINSFFNASMKYENSPYLPNILAGLIFVCRNIQGFIGETSFAPLLIRSLIFDSSVTIFDNPENFIVMSRLRHEVLLLAIMEGAASFNELLETFKLYPRMLSEIFYRLCVIKEFYVLIKHTPKAIRGITSSVLYYTFLNETETTNIEEIEETRRAQFSFLNIILSKKESAEIMYQDTDFVSSFLILLFENNLRKYVLEKMLFFFTEAKIQALNYTIGPLVTVFAQNNQNQFSNKDFCSLIIDTIKMLSQTHKSRKGLSSIIGPIHESINIMIHNMPPTEETEAILFQCINLFTEARDDNMLTNNSMIMMSESIINFYKGSPTEDLYHRIIQLFIGDPSAKQIPAFEIKHKSVLPLLFQVFISSELSQQMLDFLSQLFSYSKSNCVVGHECEIDLQVINLLDDIRKKCEATDEKKKEVDSLLDLFIKISTAASSEKSILKFCNLLKPLDDGGLSEFHTQFINALYTIVYSDYQETGRTFAFKETKKTLVNSLDEKQLTFVFWISINELAKEKTDIITLSLFNRKLVVFVEGENICAAFENEAPAMIGKLIKTVWSFVTINVALNGKSIDVDTSLDLVKNKRMSTITDVKAKSSCGVRIHINKSSLSAELSYIGLFPMMKDDRLTDIYRFGPIMKRENAKGAIIFEQNASNKQLAENSFTKTLSQKMKFFPLMKYFSTISLDKENSIVYIGILSKIMTFSPRSQSIFVEQKHTKSLAWILLSSSGETMTFELYLSIYSLFMSLENKEIRNELFASVLSDPGWWCKSSKKDHESIVAHWARILYTSFMPEAASIRTFSSILDSILIYYWPNASSTEDENNENEVDPYFCRSNFHIILQKVASVRFTSTDFIRLLAQCYTCNNIDFSMYLMLVMNSLLMELPDVVRKVGITSENIAIFQFLLNKNDDRLTSDVIEAVVQIHRLNIIDEQLLSVHLDALMLSMKPQNYGRVFFKRICTMMETDTPELLSLCCWYASSSDDETVCNELSQALSMFTYKVKNHPVWVFWPLIMAVDKPSTRVHVFEFLFRGLGDKWFVLLPNIFIACKVLQTDHDSIISDFIFFLIEKEINFNILINVVTWFLSSRESYTFSPIMSQFAEENETPEQKPRLSAKNVSFTNLSTILKSKPDFKFGLRLDKDGKWLDYDLANKFASSFVSDITDATVDQFAWIVLMISKSDRVLALHIIYNYLLSHNSTSQVITSLTNNLSEVTSASFYKKVYKAPLKNMSIDFDKLFSEAYQTLSESMGNFFEIILPKFTSDVMSMVDIFNDNMKQKQEMDKKTKDDCFEAFHQLMEITDAM